MVTAAQLRKGPGDTFGATIGFRHMGVSEKVWVGIGVAYGQRAGGLVPIPGHNPPFCYAMKEVMTENDPDWADYTIEVEGTFPEDLQTNVPLDAQRFIAKTEPVAGEQPPNDYGLNNWDDDVYNPGAGLDLGQLISTMMMVMVMSMMMGVMGEAE